MEASSGRILDSQTNAELILKVSEIMMYFLFDICNNTDPFTPSQES